MEICFRLGGQTHCYYVPIAEWPVAWKQPGPGPVNIPWLVQDVFVLAAMQNAAGKVTETTARDVLLGGIRQAVAALQKRAGSEVTIKMTATS